MLGCDDSLTVEITTQRQAAGTHLSSKTHGQPCLRKLARVRKMLEVQAPLYRPDDLSLFPKLQRYQERTDS